MPTIRDKTAELLWAGPPACPRSSRTPPRPSTSPAAAATHPIGSAELRCDAFETNQELQEFLAFVSQAHHADLA
jgi:hypothetical protein